MVFHVGGIGQLFDDEFYGSFYLYFAFRRAPGGANSRAHPGDLWALGLGTMGSPKICMKHDEEYGYG